MKIKFFSVITLILLLVIGCSKDDKNPAGPSGDEICDGSGTCTSSIVTLETAYYPGSGAMSYYPSVTCDGTSSIGWCENPDTPSSEAECNNYYGEYSCNISGQGWTFHSDCTFTRSIWEEVSGTWSEDSNGILMTNYDLCYLDGPQFNMTQEECIGVGYWVDVEPSQIGTDLSKEIIYDGACVSTILQTTEIECVDHVPSGNR